MHNLYLFSNEILRFFSEPLAISYSDNHNSRLVCLFFVLNMKWSKIKLTPKPLQFFFHSKKRETFNSCFMQTNAVISQNSPFYYVWICYLWVNFCILFLTYNSRFCCVSCPCIWAVSRCVRIKSYFWGPVFWFFMIVHIKKMPTYI